jgi:hypothetical protein
VLEREFDSVGGGDWEEDGYGIQSGDNVEIVAGTAFVGNVGREL